MERALSFLGSKLVFCQLGSYCWSQNPLATLSKESLANSQSKVPRDQLSKTIQDVISVPRNLQVPYLRVDSLCIVRDDAEEWGYQSKKVADIYAQALLAISALGSYHGEGLFPPGASADSMTTIDWTIMMFTTLGLTITIGEAGLKQGRCIWPYQSHIMTTRRILPTNLAGAGGTSEGGYYRNGWCPTGCFITEHFNFQIYPECNKGVYSEDGSAFKATSENLLRTDSLKAEIAKVFRYLHGPTGYLFENIPMLSNSNFDWLIRRSKLLRKKLLPSEDSLNNYRDATWGKVLFQYSDCDITYQSDKLPAIQSLSGVLGAITHGTLCQGLWFETLAEELA